MRERALGGPAPATAALVIGAVLGLAAFSGCQTPGHDPGPPVPVDAAALYAQMCARCHGLDGRGDAEIKKTLPVRDFSDPTFLARADTTAIAQVIMAGRNQMPAFGGAISMPKIQALSGYVRRLGRAAPKGGAQPSVMPGTAAAPTPAVVPAHPAPQK